MKMLRSEVALGTKFKYLRDATVYEAVTYDGQRADKAGSAIVYLTPWTAQKVVDTVEPR